MAVNSVSSGVSCVPPSCGRVFDGGISGLVISHGPSGTIQLHALRAVPRSTTASPRRTRCKGPLGTFTVPAGPLCAPGLQSPARKRSEALGTLSRDPPADPRRPLPAAWLSHRRPARARCPCLPSSRSRCARVPFRGRPPAAPALWAGGRMGLRSRVIGPRPPAGRPGPGPSAVLPAPPASPPRPARHACHAHRSPSSGRRGPARAPGWPRLVSGRPSAARPFRPPSCAGPWPSAGRVVRRPGGPSVPPVRHLTAARPSRPFGT